VIQDEMRAAVIAHLVERTTATEDGDQAGRRGWTSSIRRADGPGADPATIELVKTKSFPTCQLHEVDYINHKGWSMHVLIKTWQAEDGTWKVHPHGGGAGPHPRRSHPWVNICAGFGPQDFTGGGHVVGDGAEKAASVRLTFANDIVIEDTIDNGVVLFYEPHNVVMPTDVTIVDDGGNVLATYQEFTAFSP